MKKSLIINLIVLLGFLFISLVGAEMVLRHRDLDTDWDRIRFFWSAVPVQSGPHGEVRYVENQNIREISLYDDQIEYDSTYRVNNFGFIDHEDYVSNRDQETISGEYAFVGDSFTAGQGAKPWVPRLRDKLRAQGKLKNLYNLGVIGTGVLGFDRLLKAEAERLRFTHVVILAITGDFARTTFRPMASGNEVRFCRSWDTDEDCQKRGRVATLIDASASKDEILKIAGIDPSPGARFERLLGKSMLWKRLMLLVSPAAREARLRKQRVLKSLEFTDAANREPNYAALEDIRWIYSNAQMHLIHLPEKDEAIRGKYKLDLKEKVEGLGIHYFPALEKCRWSATLYHNYDPHPNTKGYQNISDCVEKYLFPK